MNTYDPGSKKRPITMIVKGGGLLELPKRGSALLTPIERVAPRPLLLWVNPLS